MITLRNISPCWISWGETESDTLYCGTLQVVEDFPELNDPKNKDVDQTNVVLVDCEHCRRKHLKGARLFWDNHEWLIISVAKHDNVRDIDIVRPKSHQTLEDVRKEYLP